MKFKVVNIGLIISLVINFLICLWIMAGLSGSIAKGIGLTLVIFFVSIGILYTPVGDWWYRNIVYHLREPNGVEKAQLMPLYNEVYERVLEVCPHISRDIKLYIYDDNGINAFAIGLKTIAVHRGILDNNIYDSEIAAILGHEFAHIANGDTFCTILAFQSNVLVSVFRSVFSIFMFIFVKIIALFVACAFETSEGAENGYIVTDTIGKGIRWLVDKVIVFFALISVLIAQYSRRKHELEADSFSAQLGYGKSLTHFFQRYEATGKIDKMFSLAGLLYGTHPSMEKRILNLQNRISDTE